MIVFAAPHICVAIRGRYAEIWEVEGAVDASIGAKRVLYEVKGATMERTGMLINCEDGLMIPF